MVAKVSNSRQISLFTNLVNKADRLNKKIYELSTKIIFKVIASIKYILYIPSKIYKIISAHKTTTLFIITAIACLSLSHTASIIAISLGCANEIKNSYLNNINYRFEYLANLYIKSLEDLSEQFKKGEVKTNDLKAGTALEKFTKLEKILVKFITNNANKSHLQKWKKYLKERNSLLRIFKNSLSKSDFHKTVFEKEDYITINAYIEKLFDHIIKTAEKEYDAIIQRHVQNIKKRHANPIGITQTAKAIFTNERIPKFLNTTVDKISQDLKKRLSLFYRVTQKILPTAKKALNFISHTFQNFPKTFLHFVFYSTAIFSITGLIGSPFFVQMGYLQSKIFNNYNIFEWAPENVYYV